MRVIAIDPGNMESAFVIWDGENILYKMKAENSIIMNEIVHHVKETGINHFCIEMVASYGMAVGQTVFDTCFISGRFLQLYIDQDSYYKKTGRYIFRKDVKLHHCGQTRAKDSNIIQALIDRFEPDLRHGQYGKGTKNDPGLFYGFSKDVWQAFALAVYYYDTFKNK